MRWILMLPLLLSCAGDQAKPQAIPPEPVSANPVGSPLPAAAETPPPTSLQAKQGIPEGEESAPSACVQSCVKSRQMQATSIAVIESDCRLQCEEDE